MALACRTSCITVSKGTDGMRSTWVDFRVLKQVVSIEMAIAYYGLTLRRVHGPYLRGRCPLPTHVSKSSVQSFIVNTEKNVWVFHSNSCVASHGWHRGGNVLDFVAAMERCSIRDAALKLQEWFSVTPSNEVRLWLSVIAYNLGNLWRRLALPTRIDTRGGCSGRSHGGLRRCRCRRDSRAFVAAGGAVSTGGESGVRKTG